MALIDHLVRHRNVYTDTSGVRRFDLLEEALLVLGRDKVLFGSDGPWLHPGVELAKVRLLGLGPSAERLVLGGNLLRLVARGGRRRGTARPQVVTGAPPVPQDPWTGAQFPLDGDPFPSPSRGGV